MPIDNKIAANCLKLEDYNQIEDTPELDKSNVKLTSYSGNRIIPEGQVTVDIQIGLKLCKIGPTLEKLGLIKVNDELLINSVESSKGLTKEDVLTEYKDVFTGLGYIGDYKIEVTEEAVPK